MAYAYAECCNFALVPMKDLKKDIEGNFYKVRYVCSRGGKPAVKAPKSETVSAVTSNGSAVAGDNNPTGSVLGGETSDSTANNSNKNKKKRSKKSNDETTPRESEVANQHSRSQRCGCKFRVYAHKEKDNPDAKWEIITSNLQHSNGCNPSEAQLQRSLRARGISITNQQFEALGHIMCLKPSNAQLRKLIQSKPALFAEFQARLSPKHLSNLRQQYFRRASNEDEGNDEPASNVASAEEHRLRIALSALSKASANCLADGNLYDFVHGLESLEGRLLDFQFFLQKREAVSSATSGLSRIEIDAAGWVFGSNRWRGLQYGDFISLDGTASTNKAIYM